MFGLADYPPSFTPPLSSYLFILLISLTSKARARGEVGAAIQVGLGSRSSGSVSFADYPVAQSGNVLFFYLPEPVLGGAHLAAFPLLRCPPCTHGLCFAPSELDQSDR